MSLGKLALAGLLVLAAVGVTYFMLTDAWSAQMRIVPPVYVLPFYAALRSVTVDIGPLSAKLLGIAAMFGSVLILLAMPWLAISAKRNLTSRPLVQGLLGLFCLAFVGLGLCGANNPDDFVIKFREDKLAVTYTDATGSAATKLFDGFGEARAFQQSLPADADGAIATSASGVKTLWVSQALVAYCFLFFAYFLFVLPKSESDA